MEAQTKLAVDHLVLVVHGVGDPRPGENVDQLARALTRDRPIDSTEKTVWLEEQIGDPRTTSTFPSRYHAFEIEQQKTVLAEVYWGDRSSVKRGNFGAVIGLLQVIFGLRFVAYQASDQDGLPAKILQWLGDSSARFLQGPLSAVNALLFLLTVSGAILDLNPSWSYMSMRDADFASLIVGLSCSVIALILGALVNAELPKRFFKWTSAVAGVLAVIAGIRVVHPSSVQHSFLGDPELTGLIWYGDLFVGLLSAFWFALTAVTAAMFVAWLFAVGRKDVHRPAIHVALLLPALTIGLWGTVIPAFWVFLIYGLDLIYTLEGLEGLFEEAVPLLGLQCVLSSVLTIVLLVVLGCYVAWGKTQTVDDYLKGSRSPRLIVHPTVQLTSAIASMIGVTVVFVIFCCDLMQIDIGETLLGRFLSQGTRLSAMALLPLGTLMLMLRPYLRVGLDIVMDVITHFQFEHDESDRDAATVKFVKREEIQARMRIVLKQFGANATENAKLTVISHSQGTVISIEVLNDPRVSEFIDRFASVQLVTMGSPFNHLYQQYFLHKYPSLKSKRWDTLAGRLQNRWINIFRIDDFVGTHIQDPGQPTANRRADLIVTECPVPPKGHTNYWIDKEVLAILHRHRIFR